MAARRAAVVIIVVTILVFGHQGPHTSQAGGTPMPSRTPMPAGVPGDWTLKFDDEFNGTSLNTAKWSTGWYGSGITPPANSQEDDCYDPAEVSRAAGR